LIIHTIGIDICRDRISRNNARTQRLSSYPCARVSARSTVILCTRQRA